MNPHMVDVARRAAVEGYLALAPDAFSRGVERQMIRIRLLA
ncbi:MAG: hypothetical protein HN867_08110 [Deltaproteobacteria bacterium]|nr:hypothetical protein [Deltaproteobacteria bacterium]MBT7203438.1 hypothetical protein [Deltaproteobacteria bacterium]